MFQSKVNYNFSNSPKVALTLSQTVQATDKKPLGRGATGAPTRPLPPCGIGLMKISCLIWLKN